MREILFRGKSVDHGSFEYGDLITSSDMVYIRNAVGNSPHLWCKVIPESVGQWTGLTDKNGTKVFEGDILELESGDEVAKTLVYWNEELSGFFDKRDFDGDSFSHYAGGLSWISDAELIGNIHII